MWKRERKGYVVICWREPGSRKIHTKPEHVNVWEQANGPVPADSIIHHRNEDKRDNRLENLECVTRVEHPQRHTENVRTIDGERQRRCGICGKWKSFDQYSRRAGGRQRYCKVCAAKRRREWAERNREKFNAYMREYRKARRTR